MTPAEVSEAVMAAVRSAADAGEFALHGAPEVRLTWGDGAYRTPVAVRLAAAAGLPGERVAGALARRLEQTPGIGAVHVTHPGLLSIAVRTPGALVAGIVAAAASYGRPSRPVPPPAEAWPDLPRTFGNRGFSVRFAYARAAAVGRHASALGVPPPAGLDRDALAVLDDPYELALLGLLAELPGRAEQAARERDAVPLLRHLERLADAYHDVHERCPALPRGDERPAASHLARCALAEAVRIALGNGLRSAGETPEERL